MAATSFNSASNTGGARQGDITQVGAKAEQWTVTPTLVAAAYASGDVLGTDVPHKLLNAVRYKGGSGEVKTIVLSDKNKQNAVVEVLFFGNNPSATTFTDNGALTVNDADLLSLIGKVVLEAADYSSFADNSVAAKYNVGLKFNAGSSDFAIWIALVARGAYTAASVGDLQVTVEIQQD